MSGFKIYKDSRYDTVDSTRFTQISVTPFNRFEYPEKGGLLYEPITEQIFYADGTQWLPLMSGGGGGTSVSYSIVKSGEQSIPPMADTIVNPWTVLPSPPYHDNTLNWDLGAGVYTATALSTVSFNVNISWKGGISNLGDRTVKVIYKPSLGLPYVAKEATTQADPSTMVDTTQEINATLEMEDGDEAWIEVSHDCNIPLILRQGNTTSVCGIEIVPP